MTELKYNRTLLFTGTGKGKTTAALGMVLRASGHGLKSLIIQFIKTDDSTGEISALQQIPEVKIIQTGLGFLPAKDAPEFLKHQQAAIKGMKYAAEALTSGKWDIIVLDEIVNAVSKGILDECKVIEAIKKTALKTVIVLTGRHASEKLIKTADTVTEMRPLKHGFETGWAAQKGVEF